MGAASIWTQTADWYDTNAASYARSSLTLAISPMVRRFAASLPAGARVLDAGCGAGRDARWLAQQGFAVSGFDASAEMVSHARIALLGQKQHGTVRHMDFADYSDPADSWDGILAMASLLHMPKNEIADTITRLLGSLAPNGVIAISLKEGQGEGQDRHGRAFSYFQQEELCKILEAATPPDRSLSIWSTLSLQPSADLTPTRWIDLIARAKPLQ